MKHGSEAVFGEQDRIAGLIAGNAYPQGKSGSFQDVQQLSSNMGVGVYCALFTVGV